MKNYFEIELKINSAPLLHNVFYFGNYIWKLKTKNLQPPRTGP